MELIYADHDMKELGMLNNPEYDLAFGEDENSFECVVSVDDHVCKEGYYIFAEGTEYGGIVDVIEIDSEEDTVTYSGRSWHGLLASKVIEPLKDGEATEIEPQIPDGYTEVEYIQSTGTQWLNTGYYQTSEHMRLVMEFTLTEHAADRSLFGSQATDNSFGVILYTSGGTYDFYIGSSPNVMSLSLSVGVAYTLIVDANNGKLTVTLNGVEKNATYSGTIAKTYPLAIFGNLRSTGILQRSKMKLESFQYYDNEVLVRAYTMCKNSSGKGGAYDFIDKAFCGNAGSGNFTCGAEIEKEEVDKSVVGVKGTDADGSSLVNKHFIISGDANYCIKYLLNRINSSPLFSVPETACNVDIYQYRFKRFTDAYSGFCKMLKSAGLRLKTICENNVVMLSAVPVFDFSDGKEMESDLIEYQMKKTYNTVNHLICIGSGKYEDRQVVHLYLDSEGNVSENQTFFGLEERIQFDGEPDEPEEEEATKTSEQLADERKRLIESGTEKLLDLQTADEIEVDFDSGDDIYYIGDIVGAYDSKTEISVAAAVSKKIVTIKRGIATITYEVKGDKK